MERQDVERKLTTILSADVVGYSRLMGKDEAGTLAALKAHRKELLEPKAAQYHGRTVKLMGDGALMEFGSVVDAVLFAIEVQCAMRGRNAGVPEERRIVYRIGINIGDIIVEGDDIYGEGVNVAARLEGLAEPGGVCVSRTVINHIKGKVDRDFEDLGEREVKNIAEPVRVYRAMLDDKAMALVTPVSREPAKPESRRWSIAGAAGVVLILVIGGAFWWRPWAPNIAPASLERMAYPLPDKPSIAVLPFDNLSGDPKQGYLVDGLTESIITELSRFRGLFVIARNSVFTYKGKPVKVQQVAEDLGVRYVLEGSMQRSNDRVRITTQLIDATTGEHLWAERYDRDMSDIFAIQDEVTETIVARLGGYEGEIAQARTKHARRRDPASLSAYETFLLGIAHKIRFTKEDNAIAQELLKRAIELDPQLARAYVGLAWTHILGYWYGWSDAPPDQAFERAFELAQKALALDDSDASAHWIMATVHLSKQRFEQGSAEFERALALNPNDADILADWGWALYVQSKAEEAIEPIERAMRLNPHHLDYYTWNLGAAQYTAQRYEEAISAFKAAKQLTPRYRLFLAASYAQLGRLEEARAEVDQALDLDPDATVGSISSMQPYQNPADLEHFRDGMRKAGLPE
ncbi:MAG: tetratricopeptide repeat protein [Alphaproteobacteria bacterium]|nr:tetratricopeptide repeat protein [Alphaproteobacteria bacterium]